MKKVLTAPIKDVDLKDLKVGDIIYYTGEISTCRDIGHKRVLKDGAPINLAGGAIFHAGPIVKEENGKFEIISIGPTTSMRMESVEAEFLEKTGVKLLVGKGGMGQKTADACKKLKAVHTVFPGGCAVVAAALVKEVTSANFLDLGMAEAFFTLKVEAFGPLVVAIDVEGNNLFEMNRKLFEQKIV
jgi:L(+)-tartrate dehydratase beta subunit